MESNKIINMSDIEDGFEEEGISENALPATYKANATYQPIPYDKRKDASPAKLAVLHIRRFLDDPDLTFRGVFKSDFPEDDPRYPAISDGIIFYTFFNPVTNTYIHAFYPCSDATEGYQDTIALEHALNMYKKKFPQADGFLHRLSIPIATKQKDRKHWLELFIEIDNDGRRQAILRDSRSWAVGYSYPKEGIQGPIDKCLGICNFQVEYTGGQWFYNDTDCWLFFLEHSKRSLNEKPVNDVVINKKIYDSYENNFADWSSENQKNEVDEITKKQARTIPTNILHTYIEPKIDKTKSKEPSKIEEGFIFMKDSLIEEQFTFVEKSKIEPPQVDNQSKAEEQPQIVEEEHAMEEQSAEPTHTFSLNASQSKQSQIDPTPELQPEQPQLVLSTERQPEQLQAVPYVEPQPPQSLVVPPFEPQPKVESKPEIAQPSPALPLKQQSQPKQQEIIEITKPVEQIAAAKKEKISKNDQQPKLKKPETFPAEYFELWDEDEDPGVAALTLLADYSKSTKTSGKNFSCFKLIFTFHWNRHYVSIVDQLVRQEWKKTDLVLPDVGTLLRNLKTALETENITSLGANSSLGQRIRFIQEKTKLNIFADDFFESSNKDINRLEASFLQSRRNLNF